MTGGRTARLALLSVLALAAGCASGGMEAEVAENVLKLRRGTVSALRAETGRGPFTAYDLPPDVMLEVLEAAARKAVGCGGRPVVAVFVSRRYGEVIAKERAPEDAGDEGYEAPFRSAMLATVRAAPGDPRRSLVEIHEVHRGPFDRGCVCWTRDVPGWVAEVLAARR